ncbi:MAG: acetoin utilization protein AcuB [Oleispira sp.]
MALIVVEMGRRVITPLKADSRDPVKVEATKNSSEIDQHHFSGNNTTPQHNPHTEPVLRKNAQQDSERKESKRTDPYTAQKQRQTEREPSQVFLLDDIMSTSVVSLRPEASVADAWQLFQRHSFRHIPIIDEDNTVLAMLSDRDILQGPGTQKNINLKNIMLFATQRVFCFSPDTDIRQATHILYKYDLGALPIISDQHKLLGIVTRTDIIRIVSHYGSIELWA